MTLEIAGLKLTHDEQVAYEEYLTKTKCQADALRDLSNEIFYKALHSDPETPNLQKRFNRASEIIKFATELPH